jgi:hypothetical protein
MQTLDPAGESLRLAEHYRQMSDGELIALARKPSELTELAQQALAVAVSLRGLKSVLEPPAPPQPEPEDIEPPEPEPEPPADDDDSPYAEERKLVGLCYVYSLADARQLQAMLDMADIPFFIGPEKATTADAVTSNFADGVLVRVMRIGLPWAWNAMEHYEPHDLPPEIKNCKNDERTIHCPRCRSTEVIFERLVDAPRIEGGKASPKFEWTCSSCGHQWQDEGLVTHK